MAEQELTVEQLNKPPLLGASVKVKFKVMKGEMSSHPVRPDEDLGFYYNVYIGKNLGTILDDGVECLQIEVTKGRREILALPIEFVDDLATYMEPPVTHVTASFLKKPTDKE